MVETKIKCADDAGPGKKRMLPTEIAHKFSCKDDFLYFFSKQVSEPLSSNLLF